MTPRLIEARRRSAKQAIRYLGQQGRLGDLPSLLENAAIRIGLQGWWKGPWGRTAPNGQGGCCVWLAVVAEVESFGYGNPVLKYQVDRYLEVALLDHFGLSSLSELFKLNDKQPDYEGQGWAIYHLNTLAKQISRNLG